MCSSPAPLNSWTWGKDIPPAVRRTQGKRLDYIFHRPPSCPPRWTDYLCSAPTSTKPTSKLPPPPSVELRCIEAEVVVRGLVPGKPYSYSDHFGVRARFEIVPSRGLLPSSAEADASAEDQTLSGAESDGSHASASSSTPLAELDERRTRASDALARTYDELGRVLRHHRKVHIRHANQLFALTPPCVIARPLSVASEAPTCPLPLRSMQRDPSAGRSDGLIGLPAPPIVLGAHLCLLWRPRRRRRRHRAHHGLRLGQVGDGRFDSRSGGAGGRAPADRPPVEARLAWRPGSATC
jgi:hypothetical protein